MVGEEKLAQNAEKHAEVVIKNITKLHKHGGSKLAKYKPKTRIIIISLGPKKSLLVKGGTILEGKVMSKIKSFVELKRMRNFHPQKEYLNGSHDDSHSSNRK